MTVTVTVTGTVTGTGRTGRAAIYLVGAPNTGKSTLFGALCGRYAQAGNREGVTVSAKTVTTRLPGTGGRAARRGKVRLTDLPGIRVVPPVAPDEQVSIRELTRADGGAVAVFVADAQRLAEGLALFFRLRDYLGAVRDTPLSFVLAVNGCDKLKPQVPSPSADPSPSDAPDPVARVLDETLLTSLVGVPAVGISARRRWGLSRLSRLLTGEGREMGGGVPPASALAVHAPAWATARPAARPLARTTAQPVDCPPARLSGQTLAIAERIAGQVLRGQVPPLSARRRRIDRLLTRGPVGVAVLVLVFAALMTLAFGPPGNLLCDLLARSLTPLGTLLTRCTAGAPGVLSSLLTEGVLGGVGAVLAFLPRLLLLWLGVGILEDTGYLPRAARLAHPFMARIGLCGEALIPLLLGFGCSVPAALTTRTVAHAGMRERVLRLLPLVTCSARMPLFSLLAEAFFPGRPLYALLFCAGMYALSAAVVLLTAAAETWLRKHIHSGKCPSGGDPCSPGTCSCSSGVCSCPAADQADPAPDRPLPLLKWPSVGAVLSEAAGRLTAFLGRVGGVILLTSLLAWLLLHTSAHLTWVAEPGTAAGEECLLLLLGRWLSLLLAPLGLSHPALAAALLAGVGAKESIVSVLAICLTDLTGHAVALDSAALPAALAASGWLTPASALSLAVFSAFYLPCTAAMGSLSSEWPGRRPGRRHRLFPVLLRSLALAWVLAWLVGKVAGAVLWS